MLSEGVVVVNKVPLFEVDTQAIIHSANSEQCTLRLGLALQTRLEIPRASAERRRAIGWNSVQRGEINEMFPGSWGSRLGSAREQARVLVRLDRQHAVFFRFRPEQFDHLSEFFRV